MHLPPALHQPQDKHEVQAVHTPWPLGVQRAISPHMAPGREGEVTGSTGPAKAWDISMRTARQREPANEQISVFVFIAAASYAGAVPTPIGRPARRQTNAARRLDPQFPSPGTAGRGIAFTGTVGAPLAISSAWLTLASTLPSFALASAFCSASTGA